MFIKCKTITQYKFQIESHPDETVEQLKEKMKLALDWKTVDCAIIYDKKILRNEQTVKEINYDDSKCMAVMISLQRKDVDESVQSSSLPIAVPVVHEEDAFYEELRKALSETNDVETVETVLSSEESIESIVGMGFERDKVIIALQVSNNNAERAVAYLLNDTTDTIQTTQIKNDRMIIPKTGNTMNMEAKDHKNLDVNYFNLCDELVQLRQSFREDPSCLEKMIDKISETNPTRFTTIEQNFENFYAFLTEPFEETG